MTDSRTDRATYLFVVGAGTFFGGCLLSFYVPDPLGAGVLGVAGVGAVLVLSSFLLHYNGRYVDDGAARSSTRSQ
jgi:hypothetical protein